MKTQEHTAGPWHLMKKCPAYDPPCDVIISEHIDDAIICSMGGDVPEVEANALLIAAAPQLLEALEQLECPECGHVMKYHADKYGCEVDRGDGHRIGSEILEALGPCGCECTDVPDLLKVIAAIRSAKGETL